jgi:glutathione reductase (NADPH)
LGAKVALIEKKALGGTCVNVGCVPKKIMWYASDWAAQNQFAKGLGFSVSGRIEHHWQTLVENRNRYITNIHRSYERQLAQLHIELIHGQATLLDAKTVAVDQHTLTSDHILLATGATSTRPDIPGADLGMDSDDFFALQAMPEKIAIIGAGYIAVELAGVLQALGSKVSIFIRGDQVLRHFDDLIAKEVTEALQREGVTLIPQTKVASLSQEDHRLWLQTHAQTHGPFDRVLWAIGRKPLLAGLGLEKVGVQLDEKGFVKVDQGFNTTVPGIYAIGDITPYPHLTPFAIRSGKFLADRLFNHGPATFTMPLVPTVIFSHPPAATAGLSEHEARRQYGHEVAIHHKRFQPMLAAIAGMDEPFAIKIITQGQSGKVLGLHMVGRFADEILQGFAVPMQMGATLEDFHNTLAIHPTLAEELVT